MSAWRIGLPLLAKELTERAARKRTYVWRVLLAALVYGLCGLFNPWLFKGMEGGRLGSLGRGNELLEMLGAFQLAGIYLFVPAMAAGLFTQEKERDSLSLLFLTRLGPWQILWQKYLGALVPVLSLMILTLPLAAIAYAYGGTTTQVLWGGSYLVVLAAAQAAAIALMCSAFFRTTVAAFFAAYCVGGALFSLMPLIMENFHDRRWSPGARQLGEWVSCVFPPMMVDNWPRSAAWSILFKNSVPAWLVTFAALGLARFWLVRRAFKSGPGLGRRFLRKLDGWMAPAKARPGGAENGQTPGEDLPGAHPIAWREMKQRALGRPRYVILLLLGLELGTAVLIWAVHEPKRNNYFQGELATMTACIGVLTVLAVSMQAANLFVSERVSQTLDVLLTTPLGARQIVWEKARAMRRFISVAAAPLLTLFLFDWFHRKPDPEMIFWTDYWDWERDTPLTFIVCSLLSVAIYLPLVSWFSLWIGLRARTRFRAIMTALALLVGWCVAPLIIGVLLMEEGRWSEQDTARIFALSPMFMQMMAQFSGIAQIGIDTLWVPIALNYSFYGALLCYFRSLCLRRADFYLRRQPKGKAA